MNISQFILSILYYYINYFFQKNKIYFLVKSFILCKKRMKFIKKNNETYEKYTNGEKNRMSNNIIF